jgi:hypothetical protein
VEVLEGRLEHRVEIELVRDDVALGEIGQQLGVVVVVLRRERLTVVRRLLGTERRPGCGEQRVVLCPSGV